ncbi:MAG: hypothetical protein NT066_03215 [Candidatus Omnitrophica bacterium]|nr:hypothetical protein [Candidatus Omnitrophota bacterium]
MKNTLLVLGLCLLVVSLVGCASLMQPSAQVENTAGAAALPPYSGPRARIAVADFDVKAAKAGGEIGSGLREMLSNYYCRSHRV